MYRELQQSKYPYNLGLLCSRQAPFQSQVESQWTASLGIQADIKYCSWSRQTCPKPSTVLSARQRFTWLWSIVFPMVICPEITSWTRKEGLEKCTRWESWLLHEGEDLVLVKLISQQSTTELQLFFSILPALELPLYSKNLSQSLWATHFGGNLGRRTEPSKS